MKKFLSLLGLMMLFVTSSWADTETFSMATKWTSNTVTQNGITVTFSDPSTNAQTGYFKFTKANTLTIDAGSNVITAVTITATATEKNSKAGAVSVDKGTITHDVSKVATTWEGSESKIVISNASTGGDWRVASIVVTYASGSAPTLTASPKTLSFALNPDKQSQSATFTLTGKNLTNGEYALTVPNLAGLTVTPTSFTVANRAVNQEFTVTYESTIDVAKATTSITATTATADNVSAEVSITYQSRATAYSWATVGDAATWDWSALTETVELTDATTPNKTEEFLLANLDDRISFTDGFGDPTAIKMEGMLYPSRAGFAQGITIKFKTSVAGTIDVDFSNTGKDRPYRYLNVNGENTTFKSGTADKVSATGIEVPAGEVVLKGYIPNANDPQPKDGDVVGDAMLRWYKITFTPKAGGDVPVGTTWEKTTSIAAGDVIVLAAESDKYAKELKELSDNIGKVEDYTEIPAGLVPLTVVAGKTEGSFAFKTADDKYLAANSSNQLPTADEITDNSSWTVTWDNGVPTISNVGQSTRKLQYNAGSPRFACYTTTQAAVTLWKQVPLVPPAVVAPTFSPEGGEYTEVQTVTLTCETVGATIYYALGSGEYTEYTQPLTISETTTISAYAQKGDDKSKVVSATYTIDLPTATLAELTALSSGTEFTFGGAALVVAKPTAKYVYIKDATASSLIFDSSGNKTAAAEVGKTITAPWTGKVSIYKNLFELVPDNALTVGEETATISYPVVPLTDVTADNVNKVVKLEGVTYALGDGSNLNIYSGDMVVAGYNQFGIEIAASTDGKTYSIVGAISRYNDNIQFQPISIEEEAAEPDPLYLVGDMNGWSRTAPTAMTWDVQANAFTSSYSPTGDGFFCITDKIYADGEDSDWSDFNSNHRWAIGENDQQATIGTEYQLQKVNGSVKLAAGEYTISVTQDMKMTITGTVTPPVCYVAGAVVVGEEHTAGFFGTAWTADIEDNKMTLDATTGKYTKTYEGVALEPSWINWKVIKDGKWIGSTGEGQADGNYYAEVTEAGTYNITFTYDPNAEYATASGITITKQGGEPAETTVTATWDFQNGNPTTIVDVNIQGADKTGTVASDVEGISLYVHAAVEGTNVKLQYNSQGYAQFNQNTCIHVPVVSTNDVVTVVSFPGQFNYTVGGIAASANETNYTATAADVKQGYVEIIATSTAYLYSIKVVQDKSATPEPTSKTANWDFQTGNPATIVDVNIQGADKTGTVASDVEGISLYVHAAVEGTNVKLQYNSQGYAQFNQNTCIHVPVVSTNDVVTVVSFPGQYNYTVGGTAASANETNYTATAADVKQGYVEIIATSTAYLYSIKVVQDLSGGDEPVAQDITATWDYSNEGVMTATMALSGSSEAGEVNSVENNLKMTVVSTGATFRNNGNNIQVRSGAEFRIPVKNVGDLVSVKGYPNYAQYTVGNVTVSSTGGNGATPDAEYKAKASDVENGYVSVVSNNDNNYYYSISVTQYAPKEPATLDNEEVTATFPFDLGTDGQKATFSDGDADYFLNSAVKVGSNFTISDKNNKAGFDETRLKCLSKETAAGETNLVQFLITPKPGFTFTPSKVSFKATRFGTDGGKMNISWKNPDATTVELATDQTPNRDNDGTQKYSEYSYTVTGATAGEGACGLAINIFNLDANKYYGFADIVIEGTLSGTEKEVPVLASFKLNGTEYQVEDVFGEAYEADFELSKKDNMVSANNPLTDITATSGEVGNVTYQSAETSCQVTIPVTLGETTLNYVLNVIQKPDFTVSYYNTDGTLMDEQAVEKDAAISAFAVDYATATAAEGMKVRGWFYKSSGGQKATVADVITANTQLYAVQTEIEESSTSKKYEFNLADPFFYAEDHEAFSPQENAQCEFHDNQHGWAAYNGDKIDLLVGPKATISIAVCKYGGGTNILVKKGNETLETLDGKNEDSDGAVVAYEYEGEAGTLTLEMVASGQMYIHSVKIVNTSETNYDSDGQWYFVKAGDASSFIDVLDVVNGKNASKTAERSYIYLPNGTYDLGAKVLTTVSGHNISIIGESMTGVTIKNAPAYQDEGIGTTATIKNTGTGNYYQNLTIENALDYYAAQAAGMNGARAVALWDTGTETVCDQVTLMSHQDTYYTNNANGVFYWNNSDIHGTTDFICGEGTLYVENSKLTLEKRKADGTGENTITAASTAAGKTYGYVFNNCEIVNNGATYNLGRAWNNEPRVAFLNTTMATGIIDARWTAKGMNVVAKEFMEYKPSDGKTTNVVTFTYGSTTNEMETIMTDEKAATFARENVLGDWTTTATAATTELEFAEGAEPTMEGDVISWDAVAGAAGYAVFKGDELLAILGPEATSYTVPATNTNQEPSAPRRASGTPTDYTVRVINLMGGMGEPAIVLLDNPTGIQNIDAVREAINNGEVYTLSGQRVNKATKGIYIINGRKVVIK